jgi:uroporphyrin-III C-methyltransferase
MAATISLLTAINATSHVHIVLGTNPLAATRCAQSLAAGARPIVIAPREEDQQQMHYALRKRIDSGEVKWIEAAFDEAHLTTLGRSDVDGFVDAVFVTSGPRDPQSKPSLYLHSPDRPRR